MIKHNAEYRAGRESWYMALNSFAAHSPAEFAAVRATKHDPSAHPVQRPPGAKRRQPACQGLARRGRRHGGQEPGRLRLVLGLLGDRVGRVALFLSNGKTEKTLAPQVYVDCVKNPHSCGGTGGCEGATMELAFNLTVQKGLALESDVPYKGRDETCTKYTAAVKATGYVKNPVNDYKALETALATVGPQSITVAAASWQVLRWRRHLQPLLEGRHLWPRRQHARPRRPGGWLHFRVLDRAQLVGQGLGH